ncbi:DUF6503 family protein [Croceivirga radicis]|uniref:DUF6503 family protein n=1 Tax=Croceivirga radicis TaxID=1929488 RepID=UPI000255B530|nr:DUF6503 family protein [Croceivirga radicis]
MRKLTTVLVFLASMVSTYAQTLTGTELLDKAIAYHDPNGQWSTFKDSLKVVMETPNNSSRESIIYLNLPKEVFNLTVKKDENTTQYQIEQDNCNIIFNSRRDFTKEEKATYRLDCDRAFMMKDYYTYLYGLPMKLKDPGTNLDPKVATKTFKGKTYLVLKVTYDAVVGKDTWYFYFDPTTYAMEVYQFYHNEADNDGEYILLSGIETFKGIKMPKTRKWYYNKDDKYLGTDILSHPN